MDEYGFRGRLTRITAIGLVPDGLRLDVAFAGTITDGPLAGCDMEGIDYLLIRPDGTGVVDARELVTTDQGIGTGLHATGYIVPPFAMPELSVLADPAFVWPDVDLPMHGSSRVQTTDSALAAATRTVYGWTGTVNVAQATLEVHAASLAPAVVTG